MLNYVFCACFRGASAPFGLRRKKSPVLFGFKQISHVLCGFRGLSLILFGFKTLSHVVFGFKAISHVVLVIKAPRRANARLSFLGLLLAISVARG